MTVRLNFLEDDLPRVRQCSTTWLSTRCTQRWSSCFSCSTLHLKVVRTALASKTLICSGDPVHRHPLTMRQRHRAAGMLARKRWNRTGASLGPCRSKSSPLSDAKPASLRINRWLGEVVAVLRASGGLRSSPCRRLSPPGRSLSTSCCREIGSIIPKRPDRTDSSQATTGTAQELPSNVSLQSSCAFEPWSAFFIHWEVYPAGKPRMTSLSTTLGGRNIPWAHTQFSSRYWYGGNRCWSLRQRSSSWCAQDLSPAGLRKGLDDGLEVVNVGSLAPLPKSAPGSK